MFDLIIENGLVVSPHAVTPGDIGVMEGRIAARLPSGSGAG